MVSSGVQSVSLEGDLKLKQLQNRHGYQPIVATPDAFTQGYDSHSGNQIIKAGNNRLIAKSMQAASMGIGTKVDLVDRFFDFAP